MGRSSLLAVGACLIAPLLVVGASADEACASNANDLKSSCIPSSKLVKDSSLLSTKTQLLKKGASAETDVARNSDKEAQMPQPTAQTCPQVCVGMPKLWACNFGARLCGQCEKCLSKSLLNTKTQKEKVASAETDVAKNSDKEAQVPQPTAQTCPQVCVGMPKLWACTFGARLCGQCEKCLSESLLDTKTQKEKVASAETDVAAKNLDKEAQMPTSTAQPTLPKTVWVCPPVCTAMSQAWACNSGKRYCGKCDKCLTSLQSTKTQVKKKVSSESTLASNLDK